MCSSPFPILLTDRVLVSNPGTTPSHDPPALATSCSRAQPSTRLHHSRLLRVRISACPKYHKYLASLSLFSALRLLLQQSHRCTGPILAAITQMMKRRQLGASFLKIETGLRCHHRREFSIHCQKVTQITDVFTDAGQSREGWPNDEVEGCLRTVKAWNSGASSIGDSEVEQ